MHTYAVLYNCIHADVGLNIYIHSLACGSILCNTLFENICCSLMCETLMHTQS